MCLYLLCHYKKKNTYRVSYIVDIEVFANVQVLIVDHADVIGMQVCGVVNFIS